MYITYSPAEKRRVAFFHCAENDKRQCDQAIAPEDRPMPARDVPLGERWTFDHPTLAELIAEGRF
jgi:hypothetical protein